MTLLHKHKINGGFLAPDRIPMEERNKNEMILELQNEVHTKDKEIERLNNIINESNKMIEKIVEEVYRPVDKEWDNILCFIEDYKLKIKELKGENKE